MSLEAYKNKTVNPDFYTEVVIKPEGLVGYKGASYMEPGFVYAPYIPLQVHRIIPDVVDEVPEPAKKVFADPIDQLMYDIGYEV